MSLITLRTFDNAFEANMLKAKLESEGVDCYIYDENTMSVYGLNNFIVGGVKLKINSDDMKKAQEIIADIDVTPLTDDDNKIIKCPACGSTDFYIGFSAMEGISKILFILLALFVFIIPTTSKTAYKCKKCGQTFKK